MLRVQYVVYTFIFDSAMGFFDEHKKHLVIVAFGLAVGYIVEHKLISGNCCIWFGSKVY